jgi:hypothetical protein
MQKGIFSKKKNHGAKENQICDALKEPGPEGDENRHVVPLSATEALLLYFFIIN